MGIGTSSPAAKIDSQEAYDTVSNILTNGTYAAKFGGNTAVGAAGRAQGIMISGRSGNTRGAAIIAENQGSGNGHDLLFATSADASVPAERLRITDAGLIGIGTDSPQTLLDISHQRSGTRPTLGAGTKFIVESSANPGAFVAATILGGHLTGASILNLGDVNDEDVGQIAYHHSDNSMRFKTNAGERARLTSDGNLGIGVSNNIIGDITLPNDGIISFHDASGLSRNSLQFLSGELRHGGAGGGLTSQTFYTNGQQRVRIDSAGLVGIGTDSPDGKLHIDGASDTVTGLVFEAGVTGDNKFIDFQNTSGDKRMGVEYDNNNVRLSIVDRSENKLLTIKEGDGNVGIGTSSPDRLLDIEGNVPAVRLTDTSVSGLHHEILGDGNSLSIEADDGNVGSGSSINFKVDGTERARLDSSGNLMAGGTISNPAFSNTSGAISLRGVVGTIEASRDGGSALELNRKTSDGTIANFRKDGATVGSIGTVAGDIVVGTGTAGLRFWDSGPAIQPRNSDGSANNDAIDLGISTSRFKDLHLSGTANAVTINTDGPTGTGNGIVMAASGWPYKGRIGMNGTSGGKQYWTANYNLNTSSVDSASYYSTYIENSAQNGIIAFGTSSAVNTAPSERARLDSSGNLLVGTTSAGTTGSQLRANGQVRGNSLSIPVFANRIGSSGVNIRLQNNSTTAGGIGTAFNTTFIYGTGGGVTDTGLAFANSQIVPCNGSGVGQDDVFDLGTSTSRFDDVFATNGTINTSDGDEKQDIEELTEAEQRVAVAVKGLLRKFRWKSRVEEKGDDARIHFGIIAQDLQAAFEAEGLDAGRYAMFINSTWTDEETGEERSRMGVRYNELLAFIIAAI